MPSTSKRQANFMKAVANNPKFAKRVGVSQKVGKEFAMADKKKKRRFADGGDAPIDLSKVDMSLPDPTSGAKRSLADSRTFGAAFRAARDAGDKTFTWRGKSYGTKLAGEGGGSKAPARSRPAAPKSQPAQASRPASGVTLSGEALKARQDAEAGRDALRRLGRVRVDRDTTGNPPPRQSAAADQIRRVTGRSMLMGDTPARPYPARVAIPNPRRGASTESTRAINRRDPDFKKYGPQGTGDMRAKGGVIKKKYAEGGEAQMERDRQKTGRKIYETNKKAASKEADILRSTRNYAKGGGIERKGKTKGTMVKMAKGGSIDGIAKKGKTRTTYPKMKRGGSC